MKLEHWGWKRFAVHGAWISDRLFDLLADLVYRKETRIPVDTNFSCLERSYVEKWGKKENG